MSSASDHPFPNPVMPTPLILPGPACAPSRHALLRSASAVTDLPLPSSDTGDFGLHYRALMHFLDSFEPPPESPEDPPRGK